jgi:hypothetical protein|tara:strand:+ start:113 stop:361 length:249 start_codon:yes stop_codon:yes gene_type:complete
MLIMMTNPAMKAYAAIGNPENNRKVEPVEKSSGLLSRTRNATPNGEPKEKEPRELIEGYVMDIRAKRREILESRQRKDKQNG